MDVETIKKFIEAGYTKADIDAMQGGNAEPSESTKEKEGTEGTEGTEGAGETDKQTILDAKSDTPKGTEVDPTIKALSDTVAELSDTIKKIQENNVRKADGGVTTDKIKEVMDSFINEL